MRRAFIISTQHWMTSTASRIARHSDPARVKGALRQSEHARLESTDGGNPNVRVVDSRAFPGSKRRYSAADGASKALSPTGLSAPGQTREVLNGHFGSSTEDSAPCNVPACGGAAEYSNVFHPHQSWSWPGPV